MLSVKGGRGVRGRGGWFEHVSLLGVGSDNCVSEVREANGRMRLWAWTGQVLDKY
jgi:hypothetical protein